MFSALLLDDGARRGRRGRGAGRGRGARGRRRPGGGGRARRRGRRRRRLRGRGRRCGGGRLGRARGGGGARAAPPTASRNSSSQQAGYGVESGAGVQRGIDPALERLLLAGARVHDRLEQGHVHHPVLVALLRPDERDDVLDLLVRQRSRRAALVRPHGHDAVRVAARVAAAHGEHVVEVVRVEVREQLDLAVQRRADAALAVGAVAARAVGLVDVVAALDRGDLLRLEGRLEAGLRDPARQAQLVEVVADHEQRHDDHRDQADPAGAGRLADDPGRPLGRQVVAVRGRRRGEAVARDRGGRRPRGGQAFLGRPAGRLLGHRSPRSADGWARVTVRCTRSGTSAG